MTKNELTPLVFIGHGSPMNALQDNDFTRALKGLPRLTGKPDAILCVSAHWLSEGTFLTGSANPKQINDFYGFPQELYEIPYKPAGSPELAGRALSLLSCVPGAALNSDWGIDHGTWAVLKHAYPQCDIPVVQLSLDINKSEREHYNIGKLLAPLRENNILIIASGNIVHNLGLMVYEQYSGATFSWAVEFDEQVKRALESSNDELLINYTSKNRHSGELAVPSNDHYLPLMYAAALRRKGEPINFIYEGFQHSSISMRSFVIG